MFFLHLNEGFINFFLEKSLQCITRFFFELLNYVNTPTLLLFDFNCLLGLVSLQVFGKIG